MKLMILGDVHGNMLAARQAITAARDNAAQHIIWAGDCGLWPGFGGLDFLDEVNFFSRKFDVHNYWVLGNHEDYSQAEIVWHSAPKDSKGFSYLRSHIHLAPRIHYWKWADRQFASASGAVSIDRQWRTEGKSWWPQETLLEAEVYGVEQKARKVDYLITHDCSNYTPWKSRLKPDIDSMGHRRKIDRIIAATRPELHFHGHMHERYEWDNAMSAGYEHVTKTYGLECDGMKDSWGILDTETNSFAFRGVLN